MCHRKGHLESIIQFRQMMADQKYSEVQKLIEVQLTFNSDARHELLLIYYESLVAQQKNISPELGLELIEFEAVNQNHEFVTKIIRKTRLDTYPKFFTPITKIKIKAAEDKGQMGELYRLVSQFLVRQFEKQIPHIPEWINTIIFTYFKNDFNLSLKVLALSLLLNDVEKSENLIRELIITSIEKCSPKAVADKLTSIGKILCLRVEKTHLEIYQNFCFISASGITEKADYKRIVEMIVYFDDFKFQTLVLNLLEQLNLKIEAQYYSLDVRKNPNYDFVYFDKYFPQLKKHFFQPTEKNEQTRKEIVIPDLKLYEKYKQEIIMPLMELEDYEDEQRYLHLIKYQDFSSDQLCDLAVSFLQSDMPRVALKASEQAMKLAKDDKAYLKGSYLKLSCHILLKDFRAALDTSLDGLNKAQSQDDILSFLYSQAEVYIRLNQAHEGKKILKKILSIDSNYRLAKERLEKLNAI